MRAELTTIHQTLTPEASCVLNNSIVEAGRRNHGHTTPIHVASTLLSSPSSFLWSACIKSHPDSSHHLQCRALALCFRVALDRLPMGPAQLKSPPISNALVAALKRAQAHQRRGLPEQAHPLLSVKVDLDQLVISILDDPSVSRVMREARLSSPAVKSVIENSIQLPIQARRCINPRFSLQSEDVTKVVEIFGRASRRNIVLVGDVVPGDVAREVLMELKNVEIVSVEVHLGSYGMSVGSKIKGLGDYVRTRMAGLGIVVDLGDLKWLVDRTVEIHAGRLAMVEISRIVSEFGDASFGRLWMIGTATCETYLRCQVYHPSIEVAWDLQALQIADRARPVLGFSRFGQNVNLLNNFSTFQPPTIASRCTECTESYEQELAKLVAEQFENSSKHETISSPRLPEINTPEQSEPKARELLTWREKTQELQKTWFDACTHSSARTELVLSQIEHHETSPGEAHKDSIKGMLGYIGSEPEKTEFHEFADSFKSLVKSLTHVVWWQRDAASAVALSVTKGKNCLKGDRWLVFLGPDRVGKRNIAGALSEHLFGSNPTILHLGENVNPRGKTALDRIAKAVRKIPSSVILLEDFNMSDNVLCGIVTRAAQTGRLVDSHGCDVGIGNVIFILTMEPISSHNHTEVKAPSESWRLRLFVLGKSRKRIADRTDVDRRTKLRLLFDLNEVASDKEDSSDLTLDREYMYGLEKSKCNVLQNLFDSVDEAIVFKPVDFGLVRSDIVTSIKTEFTKIMGEIVSFEVDDEATRIVLGGVWHRHAILGEWVENVIIPSFNRLKEKLGSIKPMSDMVVRLEPDGISGNPGALDWLSSEIEVVVDGVDS